MSDEYLKQGRTIDLKFLKNQSKDKVHEDIQYSGFDFYWLDDKPIKTGLDKFCQRGVKLFLGDLPANEYLLTLTWVSVAAKDTPYTPVPEDVRSRRFFILKQGTKGIIHFRGGIITDVIFDEEVDEPAILYWTGLPDLKDGERCYFDMVAKTLEVK